MKVFLDTNIWVRFFTKDVKEQFEAVKKLFGQIDEGSLRPYTSTIVLLELQFILQKLYSLSFDDMIEVFSVVRETRNITIIEKTSFNLAYEFYLKYKIKFPDCLIASQLPENITLVTFDEEFKKVKEIVSKTPAQVIIDTKLKY